MSKKSIACIIYDDIKRKIFIAKRNPGGDMGDRWEFPGGKVENNEDEVTAIKREMMEEFSVESEVFGKIAEAKFEHNNAEVLLEAYKVTFAHDGSDKKFILTEHTDYKWVDIDEIPKLTFVDSDLKIYPAVVDYISKL